MKVWNTRGSPGIAWKPMSWTCLANCGLATSAFTAAFNCLTIASGVPPGASIPYQPGATGMICIQQLMRAPNDGSVVSLIPLTSGIIFPMFRKTVPFDFQADFEPIVTLVTYPLAFSVANRLEVSDWRGYQGRSQPAST